MERVVLLNENTGTGSETGAGRMRNRCAFTSRDMGADWPEAFTYAIVLGWDDDDDPTDTEAMTDLAEKFGWDDELVAFLRDARERFRLLPNKTQSP